jgi:hypothetical protein
LLELACTKIDDVCVAHGYSSLVVHVVLSRCR